MKDAMQTTLIMPASPDTTSTRRYIFIEYEDGFRIEGRERNPVEVRLSPNHTFIVISDGNDSSCVYASINMYAYPRLLKVVVNVLMQDWVPPVGKAYWSGAFQWAISKAEHGLHYAIYPQWQRLLALVPEQKRLVSKSVFAATFDFNHQGGETWDEIYEQPFLVKDIIQYRAAAIACHYALQLVAASRHYAYMRPEEEVPYEPAFYAENRRDWIDLSLHKPVANEILNYDWKTLFAYDGKAHKSLCRTLMNLPGGINGSLLCSLPSGNKWLNRPITDRLELLTFLTFANITIEGFGEPEWVGPTYAKASREEIKAALHTLSKHLRRELKPRRQDLVELVRYIHDYARVCALQEMKPHRGNLVGLVEKAIEWHRRIARQHMADYMAPLGGNAAAARPPIALPDDQAVTFLASAQDIANEGMSMRHCIATYARSAVQGTCYLFHVEYQGTQASVMVDYRGNVVQSYGPHNSITAAAEYGRHVLSGWGKNIPDAETVSRTRPADVWDDAFLDHADHPF